MYRILEFVCWLVAVCWTVLVTQGYFGVRHLGSGTRSEALDLLVVGFVWWGGFAPLILMAAVFAIAANTSARGRDN